ncbi:hypothetical protein Golob_011758, partial [Gossypium lobatum]|nr:hypothetical protein [Gossypium lobatum]
MPSGFDKLTKLQTLSNFIIGIGDGHLIRELKILSNLRGGFCPSGLENVNGRDAREFKEKLEQLIIENYVSAKFSSWMDDSSFKNLLSLKLRNYKNCKSLPSVGRFSLLKYLSIIGFREVQKIGVEFFGENELNPFASLEILSFESLPNWMEWGTCEGLEYLSLSISNVFFIDGAQKYLQSASTSPNYLLFKAELPIFKTKLSTTLKSLIKSLPRGLDKLIHLQEIRLRLCSNLVPVEDSGLVTTNLKAFSVDGCGNFGALQNC